MNENKEAKAGSLSVAQDSSIMYLYIAPKGHKLADCMRPDYWRHNLTEVSRSRYVGSNPYNKIEIISDDGTWEALLRVVSVSSGLVQTRLLFEWKTTAKPGRMPSVPEGYKVEHIPNEGWRALDPNKSIIAAGEATEEDAIRSAASHGRKVAA